MRTREFMRATNGGPGQSLTLLKEQVDASTGALRCPRLRAGGT
jgi:hypothetical protein